MTKLTDDDSNSPRIHGVRHCQISPRHGLASLSLVNRRLGAYEAITPVLNCDARIFESGIHAHRLIPALVDNPHRRSRQRSRGQPRPQIIYESRQNLRPFVVYIYDGEVHNFSAKIQDIAWTRKVAVFTEYHSVEEASALRFTNFAYPALPHRFSMMIIINLCLPELTLLCGKIAF
ncbi:hypothetical protein QBC47DRAFT_365517 [Echria macrotheca]|uniref:Uncharacterized protein n=1 Tax=Echria macrotheca TaxID=438768 RepID=A0AAJ0F0F6_9PEZI|nr:hypothetical protein QBC47DRAFT_365517 [Echria macrotheca]